MWITRAGESQGPRGAPGHGGRDMDKDLIYYRRRRAEEQAAEDLALNPKVRAAHRRLVAGYDERIAALEQSDTITELHLVRAR